jgi:DNA primase large subunit
MLIFTARCILGYSANVFYRVFEHLHKAELKRAKDEGIMTAAQLETIVHPNEYFKRSYLLKNLNKQKGGGTDVKMEG